MYIAWRDLAKDLMIARNYVPGAKALIYPDADFQAIGAGMRRLRQYAIHSPQHRLRIIWLVSRISMRESFRLLRTV